MTHERVGSPLRVVLLDPNSNTLPYDRALARALTQAGAAVELVTSPFLYERRSPPAGYRTEEHFFRLANGWLGRRLAGERRPELRRLLKAIGYPLDWLTLLARLLVRPPTVVHVQWSLWPAFDRRLWAFLQRRGVPVIYTAHNLLPHTAVPGDAQRYRALYQAADAVIVHTEHAAAELTARFGVPPGRIHVAPHGPLLEEEPALSRGAARARLGLPADAPLVLFAGLIEPYKGLADLVAAFVSLAPSLPAARLVVAGRPNAPVAAERAALAAAGLTDRVHFDLRFLPQPELAAYLCAADVIALPYRAATSSGLLLAARRFGCPVVATAVGDLAVLVEDGVDGRLVPPANPAALAAALTDLLADPALATRLGEAGRQAALAHQGWPLAAERTLAAYRAARTSRQ